MGLLGATYTAPGPIAPAESAPFVLAPARSPVVVTGRPSGPMASIGAFLAIGCPVCNKIALVLLGTSGAMTVFAPLQPVIGAVSLDPSRRHAGVAVPACGPAGGMCRR